MGQLHPISCNDDRHEYALINGESYPFGYIFFSQNGEGEYRLKLQLGARNYRTVLGEGVDLRVSGFAADSSESELFNQTLRLRKGEIETMVPQLPDVQARRMLAYILERP